MPHHLWTRNNGLIVTLITLATTTTSYLNHFQNGRGIGGVLSSSVGGNHNQNNAELLNSWNNKTYHGNNKSIRETKLEAIKPDIKRGASPGVKNNKPEMTFRRHYGGGDLERDRDRGRREFDGNERNHLDVTVTEKRHSDVGVGGSRKRISNSGNKESAHKTITATQWSQVTAVQKRRDESVLNQNDDNNNNDIMSPHKPVANRENGNYDSSSQSPFIATAKYRNDNHNSENNDDNDNNNSKNRIHPLSIQNDSNRINNSFVLGHSPSSSSSSFSSPSAASFTYPDIPTPDMKKAGRPDVDGFGGIQETYSPPKQRQHAINRKDFSAKETRYNNIIGINRGSGNRNNNAWKREAIISRNAAGFTNVRDASNIGGGKDDDRVDGATRIDDTVKTKGQNSSNTSHTDDTDKDYDFSSNQHDYLDLKKEYSSYTNHRSSDEQSDISSSSSSSSGNNNNSNTSTSSSSGISNRSSSSNSSSSSASRISIDAGVDDSGKSQENNDVVKVGRRLDITSSGSDNGVRMAKQQIAGNNSIGSGDGYKGNDVAFEDREIMGNANENILDSTTDDAVITATDSVEGDSESNEKNDVNAGKISHLSRDGSENINNEKFTNIIESHYNKEEKEDAIVDNNSISRDDESVRSKGETITSSAIVEGDENVVDKVGVSLDMDVDSPWEDANEIIDDVSRGTSSNGNDTNETIPSRANTTKSKDMPSRVNTANSKDVTSRANTTYTNDETAPLDDRRIVSSLLDNLMNGYDKRLRPGFGEGPVIVKADIEIRSMGPISEKDMIYSMDCYFRQVWADRRLSFNSTLERVNKLTLNVKMLDRIWKPDTIFGNGGHAYRHTITTPNMFFRLSEDGTILYSQRLTIKATCPMHLEKFPMDTQQCPLQVRSFGYPDEEVHYEWRFGNVRAAKAATDMRLSQFDLKDTPACNMTTLFKGTLHSVLTVYFYFRRHTGYFLIQVYLPCCLLVILSWVSFWINREATSERISLGATSMLTLTLIVLDTRNDLPKVTYPTALDMYVATCFSFIFASIVQFAAVHFHTKFGTEDEDIPRALDTDDEEEDEESLFLQRRDELPYDDEHERHRGVSLACCLKKIWGCLMTTGKNQKRFSKNAVRSALGLNSVSRIDKMARVVFPAAFSGFNIVYWMIYL